MAIGPGRHLGKLAYVFLLLGILSYTALTLSDLCVMFWKSVFNLPSPQFSWLLWSSALVLLAIVALDETLAHRNVLRWRLFKSNINFIPMQYRGLRWFFLGLLIFQLPLLAFTEEAIFRAGWLVYPTVNWFDGFLRSIAFGFAHVVAGVPLRGCLVLVVGGLWFTNVYLGSGQDLDTATYAHTLYNLLAFAYTLSYWAHTGKNPFAA